MYWLTPFKYLLEGFLGLLLDGVPIECSDKELALFSPPPGQDCQTYAGAFVNQAGGYIQTQPNGQCGYCQYADGTAFAASFNVNPTNIWRNFGIMCKFSKPSSHLSDYHVQILTRTNRGVHPFPVLLYFPMHMVVSWRIAQDHGDI
jgi:hypothetical protein